jgi:hypothetical protein
MRHNNAGAGERFSKGLPSTNRIQRRLGVVFLRNNNYLTAKVWWWTLSTEG